MPLPLLRAYIDETGDRGHSGKSSAFFAFAAVLVADEDEGDLRAAMSKLRRNLSVPAGKALHWNQHVKTFQRRQHVATELAATPSIMIIYVIVEKTAIPVSSGLHASHQVFYNYAAGMMTERLLLAARDWTGGSRDVVIRFGHVRGFDHTTTQRYFALEAAKSSWIPWNRLHGNVHFSDQSSWDGLQAADQYAGMLNVAVTPDEFGGYQEAHLLRIRHQIRRDWRGQCKGWGFKVLGNEATFTSLPWWPAGGL